jgi:hypothetical protein
MLSASSSDRGCVLCVVVLSSPATSHGDTWDLGIGQY